MFGTVSYCFVSRAPSLSVCLSVICHSLGQSIVNKIYYSFFLVSLGGVRLSPLGTSATVGLLYQPRMIDNDWQGKRKYSEKTCPSATLATTNLT
jgi:hypothetical protein